MLYVYKLALLACAGAASVARPAGFSFSSLLDAIPALHPFVDTGSNKCEAIKSLFGLTYEQMLVKNYSSYFENLHVDLITRRQKITYNLTATRSLNKVLERASRVVVLIHGFMESSDGLMVQALAPELLKLNGLKILALDGRDVINLEYFRSSSYVRFMGEKLGIVLGEFIKDGLDPSKITLIGHSLGAHISGVVGKKVREVCGRAVSRIAALDPAGPCFSSADTAARLHKDDAEYVDVIHTNAGLLGYTDPVGDKDFYPNGGKSQPGCYLSTCDHSRVWQYFAESIHNPDRFLARKCENWTMFTSGQCSKNEVALMGFHSEAGSPGSYFLTTDSASPFGMGASGLTPTKS